MKIKLKKKQIKKLKAIASEVKKQVTGAKIAMELVYQVLKANDKGYRIVLRKEGEADQDLGLVPTEEKE